ncbi:unnamed protein product [Ophioblennius macclurei]
MGDSGDCRVLQRGHLGTGTGTGTGTVVKLESGLPCLPGLPGLPAHQDPELHYLRSRVRELEREKSELVAENHRLKNMLVHEIPGLLSSMWQTIGQVNGHHPVSMGTDSSYHQYSHQNHAAAQDPDFSPEVHIKQVQEELSEDLSWAPLGSDEEEVSGGAHLLLGSHMGEEAPLCSQTDMEELRRSCSESQCAAGDHGAQVSQVEVYPGSGVLCDGRSWQAANQAQSPTAMARMLLLGVFDTTTLMNSNLRGGRSRRPAFQQQRNALDPHKTNAIFNAILARFPLAKKGVIGSCINSKLSEMRFRSRRANREQHFF